MTVPLAEWLATFSTEYLDEFIPAGGATVKFLVGDDAARTAAIQGLRDFGGERGFLVAPVDAAVTRAHLVDQLFFSVARQIDWLELAATLRTRALDENGYSDAGPNPTMASIAHGAGLPTHVVTGNIQRWLSDEIFRDYRMSQDFRIGMMHLCLEPLSNPYQGDGGLTDIILRWLEGDLRLTSALKPATIYQKISRSNARDALVSLAHWARLAGRSGILVALDVTAYLARSKGAARAGSAYYTRAAAMDLYEALRQFIDSVDEMDGAAIVVLAAPEFLSDDDRGLRMYRALEARVAEEVRDRVRDNPVAGLVRLGAA